MSQTTFEPDTLRKFLDRTSISVVDGIPDDGGKVSPVVFRDRPLLRLTDGSVVPVFPPFLLEKLTQDIFWWLKPLTTDQQLHWQQQWGYIAEAYVLRVLARCAHLASCQFKPRLMTAAGEIDAVMWSKGQVAVFEITSSGPRAAEGTSVRWQDVRDGLRRAFVERPGTGKKEAIFQLARDVRLVLNGGIQSGVSISNLQRIYPVMIGTDRSVRTVGVSPFLEEEFAAQLTADERQHVAGLAIWGLEDLETLESLLHTRADLRKHTPHDLLKVLRRWDLERGQAPSWWQFVAAAYGAVAVNDELQEEFEAFRATLPTFFRRDSVG